jgi:hypothetical protein
MQKHLSFGITAAVLLTAIVTLTLYTVNAAQAQGDAAKNITNATAGPAVVATKNMTGVIIGAAKNAPGK